MDIVFKITEYFPWFHWNHYIRNTLCTCKTNKQKKLSTTQYVHIGLIQFCWMLMNNNIPQPYLHEFYFLCFRSGSSKHHPETENTKQTSLWSAQENTYCLRTVLLADSFFIPCEEMHYVIFVVLCITILHIIFVQKRTIQMNRIW